MKCPFRNGVKFDLKKVGDSNSIVITSQEEYYPECYEEECPYYEYPNGCAAVDKEIGD